VLESVASANLIASGCAVSGDCFAGPLVTQAEYDDWVLFGKPDCWCYANQCYGDTDGNKEGGKFTGWWYVGSADITLLSAAWKVKEPPKGPGIATITDGICADFDHQKEGGKFTGWWRVGSGDITIMSTNWKVKEPPKGVGLPADCVTSPVTP
jgi:hypothetical protein